MSERDLNKKALASRRVRRPVHPSPSPTPAIRQRGTSSRQVHRRLSKQLRPIETFKRCNSEPALLRAGVGGGGGGDFGQRSLTPSDAGGVLYRPQTCEDIFSSSSEYMFLPRSPRKSFEGYKKDAKVVVNVTVEGSPGPIRALVKLGSSVEETIKLVIDKYSAEGRTPSLDKNATSTFELHHSYFSLQSLNKSDAIGDAGSRSFFLRKSSSYRSSNASLNPDNLSDNLGANLPGSPLLCLQSFIVKIISKIIRRTHKLWKILGCVNCYR